MGKYDDAWTAYVRESALRSTGESSNIARLYAVMGKGAEARRILGSHTGRWPEVHLAIGDKDTALSLLFKSVDKDQSDDWPLYVMSDPQYDTLRSDPRWKELLSRMNLMTN
jgi:hypothetical protein